MMPIALAISVATAIAAAPPASQTALEKFDAAWSKVDAYSSTLVMHETKGNDVQDRTYAYTFKKPNDATIVVTAGPGRGGKESWSGGDSVVGSPPGLLSGIKLHLNIHDSRVTTLRGDTIAMASFGWVLDHFRRTRGSLEQTAGPATDGSPTTELTLAVADPAADEGFTREVLVLSNATNLPVDVRRYAGAALVKEIRYTQTRTTVPGT